MKKLITVGIPAFHATQTICDVLSSIQIQSLKSKDVAIIISNDDPKDNKNYDFVKKRFPELDITILTCDANGGPGIARQRCLDACKSEWITFIDADDIFISPYALEALKNNITPNCIEVFGTFFQEVNEGNLTALEKQQIIQTGGKIPPRMTPRNDHSHPWVFGRLYNVKFLKDNKIGFSRLRSMEDGELNWKLRMTVEGSPLVINRIEDPIYLWRTGSDHSITRIGIEENDGTPLYNEDLCQVGATAASINAIKFCKKSNPFNGSVTRFTVEMMIGQYFTYVKCLENKPMFAKQDIFNAKRFYNECYKDIEDQIDEKILKDMYTFQLASHSQEMIGIIPKITFFEFMDMIRSEEYGGKDEFDAIRAELPDWVKELDMKSGVLGEEGYIYVTDEL